MDFVPLSSLLLEILRLLMLPKSFLVQEKKEEVAAPAPAPSKEEVLLAEIRDILKEQNKK